MKKTLLLSLSASLTLSACSGLTGLKDARSDFACSVASEPFCGSLSAVHEAIDRESTVTIRESVTTDGTVPDRLAIETPLMTPKRAPEEILRLWIAPYIDSEGDLHAEHVIFATVRHARWAPETLKAESESRTRLLTPLKQSAPKEK